jgi:hypothetical protein
VIAAIRKHVQAGRRGWEHTLRVREEQRLLEAVLGEGALRNAKSMSSPDGQVSGMPGASERERGE